MGYRKIRIMFYSESSTFGSAEPYLYILYVVGDGPGRRYLEELVINLKLEDSVKFFGKVPHSETVKYYNMCWVYCLPAIEEPAPNSVLEAMSCGKAVVATDGGGIPYIIEDRKTGLIVPQKNPENIAEVLITILKDEVLRKNAGENARMFCIERFNIMRLVDKIEDVYTDCKKR